MSGAPPPSGSESESASSRQWRAVDSDRYIVAGHNGEYAVYHRPSGKTHFLNEAGLALITEILAEPRTVESAARMLAGCNDDEDCEHEFIVTVAQTMSRLAQTGFIYPA